MRSAEEMKNAASRYNQLLADRVKQWRRTRFILMGALLVLAGTVYLSTDRVFLSLPFVAGAAIAFLFWLDASEHLREIRNRNWRRLTPTRSSNGSRSDSPRTSPAAAGQPSRV